jgi:hypothetical protein
MTLALTLWLIAAFLVGWIFGKAIYQIGGMDHESKPINRSGITRTDAVTYPDVLTARRKRLLREL